MTINMNSTLMLRIVEQSNKIEQIKNDVKLLSEAMSGAKGIIWEAFWEKKYKLENSLPKERRTLTNLWVQVYQHKNNRENRRQKLLSDMLSNEREITA